MPEYIRSAATGPEAVVDADEDDSPSAFTGSSSSSVTPLCYIEDDRQVCTVSYAVCPCDEREQLLFGIHYSNIYCYTPRLDPTLVTGDCVTLLAESNGYSL